MASDHLPKSKGMRACHHSLSCAVPGDWFPGDTSVDGNECTRIISAKLCSESLKHHGVSGTLGWKQFYSESIDIIKYQVTKWCHVWGQSPASIPSSMSCSGGGHMYIAGGSGQVRLGFFVTLSLAWSHGSLGPSFLGLFQCAYVLVRSKEPAAKLLGLQAAVARAQD